MITGNIEKMRVKPVGETIEYSLPVGEQSVDINPYINKELKLRYTGEINCINCGRKTKKSFNQGYCFPCSQRLAACDICIVRPERCHFHEGTCREPEWAQNHCMQPHIVYLANSSGVKVGLTRHSQIPTRWIDQGAVQALPIYQVINRYQAGLLEEHMKSHVNDKTDWRRMLKGEQQPVNLTEVRDALWEKLPDIEQQLNKKFGESTLQRLEGEQVREFSYPVTVYPEKIKSLNFDKTPEIGGLLQGIKGQYLIFDNGVINIRKFTGYKIEID